MKALVFRLKNFKYVSTDVMLFVASNVQEFLVLKNIMDLFCKATEMEINIEKYSIKSYALGAEVKAQLRNILPFSSSEIDVGIK